MAPASASNKIILVVEIDMARRNNVVKSSTAGNVEKAKGPGKYIDSMTSKNAIQIFRAINTSMSAWGNGNIIMNTIPTTANAAITSALVEIMSDILDNLFISFVIIFYVTSNYS